VRGGGGGATGGAGGAEAGGGGGGRALNYGLHLSASGALVNLHRMDVLANNLANVGTYGFKPELVSVRQRDPARVEDGLGTLPSSALLERLGGGVLSGPNRISFEQGTLESSGNPFDLAIEGDGFFVVRDENDVTGDRQHLTRDGRFTLDRGSRLVSATTGLPVMDVNNRAIEIKDANDVQISADGTIRQRDVVLGQLQIIDVPDRTRLSKAGHGQFRATSDAMANRRAASGQVRQGMLEGSAVDPVGAMLAITEAGRAAEANLAMIQTHDRLMDRAINVLGRVS
jgi:flagellar basal-body rod protein FlgF